MQTTRNFVCRASTLLLLLLLLLMLPAQPGYAQSSANTASDRPTAQRPNILMIYIDDMGWRDTGFMGSDFYETPHLDKLANESLIFTDAYSCAANCSPARACLMSGQYTPRHKLYNVGTRPRGKPQFRRLEHIAGVKILDPRQVTFAKALQDAGYVTASFGKWHLSEDPIPYGFDFNLGGSISGSPPRGYYPPHPKAPGLEAAPPAEYLTDRLSDEACQFIEKHRQRSWMLYLSHFAVHSPLQAKRELAEKYQNKQPGKLHQNVAMGTMVEAVDTGVGRILKTLKRLELEDRTAIIFCSDNGGFGEGTDMTPLRGHKGTYYEGGIRVPMFVRLPGVQATRGKRTAEPVTGVDLYPTIIELAGVTPPAKQILDGQSLVPLIKGNRTTVRLDGEPRSLFWFFPAYLESGRNRAIHAEQRDPIFRTRPCSVIRQGQWKLLQYFESGDLELYDLRTDISESKNLIYEHPEVAQRLKADLLQWQQSTGADVPRKLNPKFDAQAEAARIKKLTQ